MESITIVKVKNGYIVDPKESVPGKALSEFLAFNDFDDLVEYLRMLFMGDMNKYSPVLKSNDQT